MFGERFIAAKLSGEGAAVQPGGAAGLALRRSVRLAPNGDRLLALPYLQVNHAGVPIRSDKACLQPTAERPEGWIRARVPRSEADDELK